MLHGHERSITQIKYNRDGDLLFSTAKDTKPNVWYSLNGERLGTYNGHGGAVWCIDVDCILEKITCYKNHRKSKFLLLLRVHFLLVITVL